VTHTATALRFTLLLWSGSVFALLGLQRFFVDPLPSTAATIAVFLAQTAPLLVVLPMALRSGARGPLWLCLVMLIYFVHGVWQWNTPDARLFGIFEVIFALGAFVTAWVLLKILPAPASTTTTTP
jgi:uncharacterized membrane protein